MVSDLVPKLDVCTFFDLTMTSFYSQIYLFFNFSLFLAIFIIIFVLLSKRSAMRFRPRSHPYAALAAAEQESDAPSLESLDGSGSLNRLLGGSGGSRWMLPHSHCCSGDDPTDGDEDTENIGVRGKSSGKSSKNGREEERDDRNNKGNRPAATTTRGVRSVDPFRLVLSPSHPCNRSRNNRNLGPRRTGHPHRSSQQAVPSDPLSERSHHDLEQLLVSAGRYLRWPLCPFHEPMGDRDVLRKELEKMLADDEEMAEEEEEDEIDGDDEDDEEKEDGDDEEGEEAGSAAAARSTCSAAGRKRARLCCSGGTTKPLWMLATDDAHSSSALWDGGDLYPDVVPGTSFARVMDGLHAMLNRRGDDDDDDDGGGGGGRDDEREEEDAVGGGVTGTGTGTGIGNHVDLTAAVFGGAAGSQRRQGEGGARPTGHPSTAMMTMIIEEPSRFIRQDPDLPVPVPMAEEGGGGTGTLPPSPRLLSVLPSIQRLASSSSGGWGAPPSSRTSTRASSSNRKEVDDMEEDVGGDDAASEEASASTTTSSTSSTSPTSICWGYDESTATSAEQMLLKPKFSLAPTQIITDNDRIEEYDADLCRHTCSAKDQDGNHIGGDDHDEGAKVAADTTPACFSEEWLRRSKRKWKMQRAIREVRHVWEQRVILIVGDVAMLFAISLHLQYSLTHYPHLNYPPFLSPTASLKSSAFSRSRWPASHLPPLSRPHAWTTGCASTQPFPPRTARRRATFKLRPMLPSWTGASSIISKITLLHPLY